MLAEANVVLENYDRILNETASRLHVLQAAVENPSLTGKIQMLRSAAHDQEKQLQNLEQNLQDIREERDSLTDIAQNLPKTCPQKGHWAGGRKKSISYLVIKESYRKWTNLWNPPLYSSFSCVCYRSNTEHINDTLKCKLLINMHLLWRQSDFIYLFTLVVRSQKCRRMHLYTSTLNWNHQ